MEDVMALHFPFFKSMHSRDADGGRVGAALESRLLLPLKKLWHMAFHRILSVITFRCQRHWLGNAA
jgi:hypothetical protein